MVKLTDIAQHLGLSVTTVSYSLNNDQRIPPETRQKVIDAARELGYVGKSGRSNSGDYLKQIVLCVNSISGGVYDEIVAEMKSTLKLNNCELMIYVGSNIARLKWLDGLFVLNSRVSNDDIKKIANKRIPVVLMDRETRIDNVSNITTNNFDGCYRTTQYAIEAGAKTFAFIGGPKDSFESHYRYDGFCKALSDYKLSSGNVMVLHTDFSYDGGLKACRFILQQSALPDAIICANDETAMGILKGLKTAFVQKNIIVSGFDGVIQKDDNYRFITAKVDRKYWAATAVYAMNKKFENGTDQYIQIPIQSVDFNY